MSQNYQIKTPATRTSLCKTRFLQCICALLPFLLIAVPAVFAEKPHLLKNENLSVWLDPSFPRVLSYSLHKHGTEFYGTDVETPKLVEVNKLVFKPLSQSPFVPEQTYTITTDVADDSLTYTFHLSPARSSLSFEIVFELHEDSLQMSLQNVTETGGFELNTLYFPEHALISVRDSQTSASVCRTNFIRNDRGIIKLDGVYKGSISQMATDDTFQPTHWGFVYTDRAAALLTNNIPVFPVHTQATGISDAASQVSVWNGVHHHRVMGKIMPTLQCNIRFVGDLSGDGQTDWMDGAWWLRDKLPKSKAEYDAFIYKIKCCQLPDDRFPETLRNAPEPTVFATFDQCLEIVRKAYHLTNGRPQIVYLVGWQHLGHDDKYPDLSVVNPYLGGREKLLNLMEEARKYNATVSLHVNCDAAYKDSPSWDPDIICTHPDGSLIQWSVMHNQENYHISHFKDMRKGTLVSRVDDLLEFLPIRHSIHYDAMRYTNESCDPEGYIGMTAELLALQEMFDRYAREDIGITIEGFTANPALVGRIDGIWHSYTHDPFLAFLLHRRWVGGGKWGEDVALGAFLDETLLATHSQEDISDIYYLGHLLRSLLQSKEMTHLSDEGNLLTIQYGEDCTVRYERMDKKGGALLVTNQGIEVARGNDRFVPVSGDEILSYSKQGGVMTWQLPDGWADSRLSLFRLTATGRQKGPQIQMTGSTIRFKAESRQPYVLIRNM